MKLERDRYYYNCQEEARRIVCVDRANESFTCSDEWGACYTSNGKCYADGSVSDYDLVRSVFEPGQRWREKKQHAVVYELKNFDDCYCCWISIYHARLTEKWLLEHCELVTEADHPDYGRNGNVDKPEQTVNDNADKMINAAMEASALQFEVAGMQAENKMREHNGEAPAYVEKDFQSLAEKMRALGRTK